MLKNKKNVSVMIGKALKKVKNPIVKLGNIPGTKKLFTAIGDLCDLLADFCEKKYDAPLATIVTFLAAVINFVSPIDVFSDAIPLIGIIDDTAVVSLVIGAAKKDIEDYKQWKQVNGELQESGG